MIGIVPTKERTGGISRPNAKRVMYDGLNLGALWSPLEKALNKRPQ